MMANVGLWEDTSDGGVEVFSDFSDMSDGGVDIFSDIEDGGVEVLSDMEDGGVEVDSDMEDGGIELLRSFTPESHKFMLRVDAGEFSPSTPFIAATSSPTSEISFLNLESAQADVFNVTAHAEVEVHCPSPERFTASLALETLELAADTVTRMEAWLSPEGQADPDNVQECIDGDVHKMQDAELALEQASTTLATMQAWLDADEEASRPCVGRDDWECDFCGPECFCAGLPE
jgi:hypothetical protein